MARGILACPVIGTGAEDDPFRAEVFDRKGSGADRLEAVIDSEKSGTCLVLYDVVDDSDLAAHKLADLTDLDKAADRIGGASKLDGLARESKVGRAGTAREVIRRIGQTISPTFDERLHLGSGEAPPTGSFLDDSFTDEAGTFLEKHTPESGGSWTRIADLSVISNANRVRASTGTMAYLAPGTPEGAEYDIASELFVFDEDGRMGPCARSDGTQENGYFFDYEYEGGTKTWRIQKRVEGAFSLLGSFKETLTLETAYPFTCEVRDAAKKLYVKGVERVSTSDDVVTAAGSVGLRHTGSADNDSSGIHISYLTATDAGGGEEPADLAASLSGTGTASGTLTPLTSLSAALTGTGSLAAELHYLASIQAALSGTGALSGELTPIAVLAAALGGEGLLLAELRTVANLAADLSGEGTLSGELRALTDLAAALQGAGTLAAELGALASFAANLEGQGVLGAELRALLSLEAALSGSGSLIAAFFIELLRVASFEDTTEAALFYPDNGATITPPPILAAAIASTTIAAIIVQDATGAEHP